MSRMRSKMSKKNKWYIEPERYLELLHFCRQYESYISHMQEITATVVGSDQVTITKGSYHFSDPTSDKAIEFNKWNEKVRMIQDSAKEASGSDVDMYEWLMMGITKDISYDNMYMLGIPCGKDYYYDCYHKFFYILDQKRD